MLYVDDMRWPLGRMIMSHMMADTGEELREACDRLGLRREYIQYPDTWREHLDVSQSKREEAVRRLGAREISQREMAMIRMERRSREMGE